MLRILKELKGVNDYKWKRTKGDAGSRVPQWVPEWTRRCPEPVRTSGPAWGPVRDTGADKLGIRAIRHTNKTYSSNGTEYVNLESGSRVES